MADDLSNYKLQLQQVEVALLSDPQNTELLKLKDDIGKRFSLLRVKTQTNLNVSSFSLDQLVQLQQELIKTNEGNKYIEPSSSSGGIDRAAGYKDKKPSLKIWKVSDKCMARDQTNGQ
jgi:survival-of-motor-neuron-related-splicing factor 30